MINIIEHNYYNAPINNETVAWLDYKGSNNKNYIVKAFKYTDTIWVIPEVVISYKERLNQQKNLGLSMTMST